LLLKKEKYQVKKKIRQEPKQAVGQQGRSMIPFAIAILVVLGLIFGGWGTVYAAQDSEPDDLLYPVKEAVDYLDELFTIAENPDDPSTIGKRDGIQIHDRDLLQGMTGPMNDKGNYLEIPPRYQIRKGQGELQTSLDDIDLPIDDTLTTTPTITATQTMSGSLWSWGPGPCNGDPEYCELTAPYGYTYTHGVDGEAPFQGDPPLAPIEGPPATENPGDNLIGFGPGANPTKEVQEPEGNTGSTGGQKQGGKP
jgi:hypothetical protein